MDRLGLLPEEALFLLDDVRGDGAVAPAHQRRWKVVEMDSTPEGLGMQSGQTLFLWRYPLPWRTSMTAARPADPDAPHRKEVGRAGERAGEFPVERDGEDVGEGGGERGGERGGDRGAEWRCSEADGASGGGAAGVGPPGSPVASVSAQQHVARERLERMAMEATALVGHATYKGRRSPHGGGTPAQEAFVKAAMKRRLRQVAARR